ncbi:MAG: recombinase family protein [Anaerolineaceae bacterium]|nr:recombinase family protein [Anaerolineaceae bacterium]
MAISGNKVCPEHLSRLACVYIRQSSLIQVQLHQESTRRQYALQERAISLGWSEEQLVIIDEDLGHSASQVGQLRPGFHRLLDLVVTGQAGAIFSLEVSRLARQDSEGYRLVEVAALTGVLLIDEQQVYDPDLSDDRLMLGLKVLLSSNEVRLMHQRLQENKLRKAQRGELRLSLPVGLIYDRQAGVMMDPDEQVRGVVKMVFEQFRTSNRLSQVVQFFAEHGILFPKHKGNWDGPLEWRPLSRNRARNILANPVYAGAYIYARTARQAVIHPEHGLQRRARPLEEKDWGVARWDAFEGYISRQEYTANQARLELNLQRPNIAQRGRRRDGPALLSGLVWCGHCGQRMYVNYSGDQGQYIAYLCNTQQIRYGKQVCQRVPGKLVDQLVETCLLAAMSPSQIEVSLAVLEELERQQAELNQQRQRRVEGAQYGARLAQRRYEQVDPDNRLVARSLEAQWEACLKEVDRLKDELDQTRSREMAAPTPKQRQELMKLAEDLPRVWNSPTTSWIDRKDLLELLIADVTLTRQEDCTQVQIRWHTNQVDAYQLPLPRLGSPSTPTVIRQRIRELYQQNLMDKEIAVILNQEGLKSAIGNSFTPRSVLDTRIRNGIRREFQNPK